MKKSCNLKNFKFQSGFYSLFFLSILAMSLPALSQEGTNSNDKKNEQRSSDKLDIKKLEQKYWAAKDDDFGVVQNRRFIKAQRAFLTLEGGIPFNNAYSVGTIGSVSGGYFFNERYGFELNYSQNTLTDNDAVKQFVLQYQVIPDHNISKSSLFASAVFVPFYAKMSFMDKAIIYFDMGLSLGGGSLNYDIAQKEGNIEKSTPAFKLGVFQQIFFTEHFAIRIDLNNTWSSQERQKYYIPGTSVGGSTITGVRDLGSQTINDTSLIFGFTYWH
jgi:outer membrane beta-barrel protein